VYGQKISIQIGIRFLTLLERFFVYLLTLSRDSFQRRLRVRMRAACAGD
jgi:hypothetical protein